MTTFMRLIRGLIATILMMSLFACSSLSTSPNTTANQELPQPQTIQLATSVPVIASMARELIVKTAIELIYLPSSRYSIKRIPGWLARQPVNEYPEADAVLGIASVWPELDIYPHLRLQNIAIIPVDLAHAYVPGGERVALTERSGNTPHFFWLNPANSLIMLGILHRDLQAVVAGSSRFNETHKADIKRQLNANHLLMAQKLRQLQVAIDNQLLELNMMQVVIENTDLKELAAATLLPEATKGDAIESGFPSLLITNKQANHKKFKNLPEHILIWHIDDFAKPREGHFTERWANNLEALKENTTKPENLNAGKNDAETIIRPR
ncbi:hypothetical protein [Litoribacillus peritrichatus]|uniref:ABC transporter substrate-binding protein n=1 Tax=Litoribacillus peritrichatus TaxID=718191 RepID=A0ABP7MKA1_9GAMM